MCHRNPDHRGSHDADSPAHTPSKTNDRGDDRHRADEPIRPIRERRGLQVEGCYERHPTRQGGDQPRASTLGSGQQDQGRQRHDDDSEADEEHAKITHVVSTTKGSVNMHHTGEDRHDIDRLKAFFAPRSDFVRQ